MWSSSLPALLMVLGLCLADKPDIQEQRHQALFRSRRMVGGVLARRVPWQTLVTLGDKIIGGGTLIGKRWVLTAGRNLFTNASRNATLYQAPAIPKVYLSITDLREREETFNEVKVDQVFLHPNFQNTSDWENDLALIRLKEDLFLDGNVKPLSLPEKDYALMGTQGDVSGWGRNALLQYSRLLKTLTLTVANHTMCKETYSSGGQVVSSTPIVDDNMFCTEAASYREDVCIGDAGGAFAVQDPKDGKVYVAGVLSFDKSCAVERYAVFMKISAYVPWIKSVIGQQ
ncbi:haptoglobin [Lepisosteus oculatus]|uniref:haptoglobin n=1 Tax=Lepisosteus oculatus TaxID=7918 RepID=UPI0035F505F5